MVIERTSNAGEPRRCVWCMLDEITLVTEGVYEFVNIPEEALGDGTEVVVMNSPGKLLFYHAADNRLYDWSV